MRRSAQAGAAGWFQVVAAHPGTRMSGAYRATVPTVSSRNMPAKCAQDFWIGALALLRQSPSAPWSHSAFTSDLVEDIDSGL
jgi:hypothetical protein